MLDFWLPAGLLLLAALGFLLIPVLRGRRAQQLENRSGLNVSLYQERLADLAAQHASGALSIESLTAANAEAARQLLNDADNAQQPRAARLGKALPLVAALLLPVLGLGLYLHWGGNEQVALTRELATTPRTIEEMTARLEQSVKLQPGSAEGWYFLGRAYMAQERAADAAKAFERVAELSGRPADVLGQWAQALFFAGDRKWTAQMQALTEEALKADPQEGTSLGLLGIVAYENADYAQAVDYWQRLLAQLPPEEAARTSIEGGIARARSKLQEQGGSVPEPVAAAVAGAGIIVQVKLADDLQGKLLPTDTVFVFARAVSGPPMPLAVKRLTVADLPLQVSLSDADAMMPQLKVSAFPEVQLMARISRSGDAKAGEWIGRLEPVSSSDTRVHELTIDTPDKQP